jgi:hypothetical protein
MGCIAHTGENSGVLGQAQAGEEARQGEGDLAQDESGEALRIVAAVGATAACNLGDTTFIGSPAPATAAFAITHGLCVGASSSMPSSTKSSLHSSPSELSPELGGAVSDSTVSRFTTGPGLSLGMSSGNDEDNSQNVFLSVKDTSSPTAFAREIAMVKK